MGGSDLEKNLKVFTYFVTKNGTVIIIIIYYSEKNVKITRTGSSVTLHLMGIVEILYFKTQNNTLENE